MDKQNRPGEGLWKFELLVVASIGIAVGLGSCEGKTEEEITALHEQEAYEAKSDVTPEERFALLHPMECQTWIAQCDAARCKPRFVCAADLTRRTK